jgi:hypothetical protein
MNNTDLLLAKNIDLSTLGNEENDTFWFFEFSDLEKVIYVANEGLTRLDFIQEKDQVKYLKDEYLNKLGASYIVLEREYISQDYLTDYMSYYSQAFHGYGKYCQRLHFFTNIDRFTRIDISRFKKSFYKNIISPNKGFWRNNYLGCMTITPIPRYFIGHTLIKTFDYQPNSRKYNANRKWFGNKAFSIHLLGHETIIDSLPFREQDRNTSACATIAVYSTLLSASETHYLLRKSPSEITRDTGELTSTGNRNLPNKGLSTFAVCQAIVKHSLTPEVISQQSGTKIDMKAFKRRIYSYSFLNNPILLGIDLFKNKNGTEPDAGHMVAVTGFLIGEIQQNTTSDTAVYTADCMTELFLNDDQWGPYVTFKIDKNDDSIKCLWNADSSKDTYQKLEFEDLVVPVTRKITIPYEEIANNVSDYHAVIMYILGQAMPENLNYCWDLRVLRSDSYKKEIHQTFKSTHNGAGADKVIKLLAINQPKYLWIATFGAYNEGNEFVKFFDLMFDAGGLIGSDLLVNVVFYITTGPEELVYIIKKYNSQSDKPEEIFKNYGHLLQNLDNKQITI